MPVPNHKWDCETRIWETVCPDCEEVVYFFSCSCESKVFFDAPKPPWPKHEDSCLAYRIRQLRFDTSLTPAQIRTLVLNYAHANSLSISPKVQHILSSLPGISSGGISIISVSASHAAEGSVTGRIMTINRNVNFRRRMNLPDNAFSRGLLGSLLQHAHDEIVLRTDPDTFRQCLEYSIFVRASELRKENLQQGNRATLGIVFQQIVGVGGFWLGRDLRRA